MTSQELGNRIRSIRKEHNLTQEDVAFKMNISIGAYYKLESGQTNQNLGHLSKLSEIYNIHIASFFVDNKFLSEIGFHKMEILSEDIKKMIADEREPIYELIEQNYSLKK